MRVISGKYKGKYLEGFDIDGTRPTMDRVKESMFASIQNYIKESNVLDLFAGSGSLGIEALSMGATKCTFVDSGKEVYKILCKNIKDIDGVNLINLDYSKALLQLKNNNVKFDIILLDPPYKMNLINDCIEKIHEYKLLNDNGIIVCEYEFEEIKTEYYKLIKEKKYGSKYVKVYINN